MKITALVENIPGRGLPAEHGLSLFVESGSTRFLFDMGQTDLFARNADALGVNLDTADFAVLSHGHYDHGGGLETFLSLNSHAPVYLHLMIQRSWMKETEVFQPRLNLHHFVKDVFPFLVIVHGFASFCLFKEGMRIDRDPFRIGEFPLKLVS